MDGEMVGMDRVDDDEHPGTRGSSNDGRTATPAPTRRRGASVVGRSDESGELSGNGGVGEDQRDSGISLEAAEGLGVVGGEGAAQRQRGGAPRRSWSRRAPRLCSELQGAIEREGRELREERRGRRA
jgi:hypothetical protein